MKKTMRKLTLCRETLHWLDGASLKEANGGKNTEICNPDTNYPCFTTFVSVCC